MLPVANLLTVNNSVGSFQLGDIALNQSVTQASAKQTFTVQRK